ncbi:MAG: roadblock/LC7 domain-containing protein [Acidimicrobiales bacterium]
MTAISLSSLAGQVSPPVAEIGDLLDRFVEDAPSAHAALLTDAHGLPLLWTGELPEETADHFAAIMLGLDSLANSAAQCFAGDRCERLFLELDTEFVFVERIGHRALLGVVADKKADLGAVGYEVTLLGARFSSRIDEAVVAELAGRVGTP